MSKKYCVVYVNPHGIPVQVLGKIKQDVLTTEEFDHLSDSVEFYNTDGTFRDILAKARSRTDLSIFFILDEASAKKGAVQAVELRQYVGEKGIEFRYPSASSSRRFYIKPKEASLMACNLDIANMDWEDFAQGLSRFGVCSINS